MLPNPVVDDTERTSSCSDLGRGLGGWGRSAAFADRQGTGASWALPNMKYDALSRVSGAADLARRVTGYGAVVSPLVCAFFAVDGVWDQAPTGWRTLITCAGYHRAVTYVSPVHQTGAGATPGIESTVDEALDRPVTASESRSTPAECLRERSGLDAGRLAAMFGVSRVTYQNWIAGAAPQGARREHLLEVLALIEEAERRLGGARAVGDWLLSPVGRARRRPIDLLAERDYDTFRGFLLRVPTGRERVRPLTTAPRVRRRLSGAEFDDALARLRPKAAREDLELVGDVDGDTHDGL